jgi:hypothetical protein
MVTDLGGGTFSAPEVLVARAAGKNRYYPTFSPDGGVLLYNESSCPAALDDHCNAYEDDGARFMILGVDGNRQPIALSRANTGGVEDGTNRALINSFPKWSPFVFQRTGEVGSRLEWFTFSSGRRYGLRPPPPGGGENPVGTFLWMAALDPTRVGGGVDPSYPAFVLPFQDLTTSNHIAQWTTRIVPPVSIHR